MSRAATGHPRDEGRFLERGGVDPRPRRKTDTEEARGLSSNAPGGKKNLRGASWM